MNKENVEGLKGGSLTLRWIFNGIPEAFEIFEANLYFNVTKASSQAVICNWDTSSHVPFVTITGKNIFGNRISVSYRQLNYSLTLTNLQYNDAGPYLLEVGVSPGSITEIQVSHSIIKISKIKGKHRPPFSYFFYHYIIKIELLVENYEVTLENISV